MSSNPAVRHALSDVMDPNAPDSTRRVAGHQEPDVVSHRHLRPPARSRRSSTSTRRPVARPASPFKPRITAAWLLLPSRCTGQTVTEAWVLRRPHSMRRRTVGRLTLSCCDRSTHLRRPPSASRRSGRGRRRGRPNAFSAAVFPSCAGVELRADARSGHNTSGPQHRRQ